MPLLGPDTGNEQFGETDRRCSGADKQMGLVGKQKSCKLDSTASFALRNFGMSTATNISIPESHHQRRAAIHHGQEPLCRALCLGVGVRLPWGEPGWSGT